MVTSFPFIKNRVRKGVRTLFLLAILLHVLSEHCRAQNYISLYNNNNFSNPINTGLAVGAIDGNHSVTASGAGTYSIPIMVPPGTHGFAPNIQIGYSSQGGDGPLGIGWSISGLSAIMRTGSDYYHEQNPTAVTFNNDYDKFTLDGARLVPNGAAYSTEANNFSVITPNGTNGTGPDWFQVVTKDGTIMEYGNTTDSKFVSAGNGVLVWRLNKVQDINGNYITFSYTQNNGEMLIDEINYTGNDNMGLQPYNKVKFNYGMTRNDPNSGFVAGNTMSLLSLLTSITITGENNATFKTYDFNYGFDGVRSYLQEVIENGTQGGQLNKTIFKYGEPQLAQTDVAATAISSDITPNPSQTAFRKNIPYAGDFNGDGISDIVVSQEDAQQLGATGHSVGFEIFITGSANSPAPNYTTQFGSNTLIGNSNSKVFNNFYIADFNGDRLDDIIAISENANNNGNIDHITLFTSHNTNGTYSVTTGLLPIPVLNGVTYSQINMSHEGQTIRTGDFDGDGITDYILCVGDNNNNWMLFVSFPGKGIWNQPLSCFTLGGYPSYALTYTDNIEVLDFDGDGKSDIMLVFDAGNTFFPNHTVVYDIRNGGYGGGWLMENALYQGDYPNSNQDVYMGDFNGDGKGDILALDRTNNYNASLNYSNGKGWVASNFAFNTQFQGGKLSCKWCPCSSWFCGFLPGCVDANTNYTTGDELYIGDFDGDGKSDVLQYHPTYIDCQSSQILASFDLYYSTGNNFYRQNYQFNNLSLENNVDFPMRMIADMNGDGKSDLTVPINQSNYLQTLYFDALSNSYENEKVIEKVEDGLDRVTQFNYTPITHGAYTPGPVSSYPLNSVTFPLYVVSTLYEPNDNAGDNAVNYHYTNSIFHNGGRGPLGFQMVDAYNAALNTTDHTENTIDPTYYVPWVSNTIKYSGSLPSAAKLATTNNVMSFSGANGIFVQHLDVTVQYDYLTNTTNTVKNGYDNYGNIVQALTIVNNGVQNTTTNTTYVTAGTPVPARPGTITTTTNWMSAAPVTTAHAYTYNSANLLSTDVYSVGSSVVASTNTYTYDGFGNNTSATLTGYNNTVKHTTTGYDSKGRFPVLTTNAMGQPVNAVFDPLWGKPTQEIDIAHNITSHQYDEWGRIVYTTPPFYFPITTTYNWDISSGGAYWNIYTVQPGHSPSQVWYNQLGKQVKTQTTGLNGVVTSTKAYDNAGNLQDETAPYLASEMPMHTTYTYDYLNRPATTTNFQGTSTFAYSFSGGNSTVQATTPTGTSSKTTDAAGKVVSSGDDNGTLQFTFDSWGNQVNVAFSNGISFKSSTYDQYGRLSSSFDHNRGTITFTYDDQNRLLTETDANNKVHTYIYDVLDRVIQRAGPEGTTIYTFGPEIFYNKILAVHGFDGHTEAYLYNVPDGTLNTKTETYNGSTVNKETYQYDPYGNIAVKKGYMQELRYDYDYNGNLLDVIDNHLPNTLFYESGTVNGLGQPTQYTLGSQLVTTKTYNNGIPTHFSTPGIQDLTMTWDGSGTQLGIRADNTQTTTENFKYDRFRLGYSQSFSSTNANLGLNFAYDVDPSSNGSRGNLEKSDAGTVQSSDFNYYLHRLTSVKTPNPISTNTQQITYTAFNQPSTIVEGNYRMDIVYNADYDRESSTLTDMSGAVIEKREYHGDWERITDPGAGTDYVVNYISGGDGICAISVLDLSNHNLGAITSVTYHSTEATTTITVSDGANSCSPTPQIYYVYKDHLGSILTLAQLDNNNNIVIAGQQNFDAWGRTRNPADWSYDNTNTSFVPMPAWMIRGFTGQEHLPQFGLIDLNARLYDPLVGRMLGPDKYIDDPHNTQDYNAYTYAKNNPLTYTDPSGNFAWLASALIFGTVNLGVDLVTHNFNMNIGEMALSFGEGALGGALGAGSFADVGEVIAGATASQMNKFVPAIPIEVSPNISLNVSPMIGFGSGGMTIGASLNGTYTSGNVMLSGGIGAGYNSGMNDLAHNAGPSNYFNWNVGAGVTENSTFYGLNGGQSDFTGKTAQRVGTIGAQVGDFNLKFSDDWPIGDGGDKYRTAALLATYKINNDVTLAAGMGLMTGKGNEDYAWEFCDPINKDQNRSAYHFDPEHETNLLRGGLFYGGVVYKGQAYFAGTNSENAEHWVQDNIHHAIRFDWDFANMAMKTKFYGYYGNFNPFYLYY